MKNPETRRIDALPPLTSMQAELPTSLDNLRTLLEESETRPSHEIGVYIFTQPTHLLLCRYPAITREYLNLYHEDPEKLTIAFSKKSNDIKPSLRISLQTGHSIIEFTSNDDNQDYTMQLGSSHTDFLTYQCSSDEIGSLLLSATLSPNHAEDIVRFEAEGGSKSINPTDPHIYPLMRDSLESSAQDYSYRRGYRLDLSDTASLHLQATSHTMEGTSIDATLTQSNEEMHATMSASVTRSNADTDGTLTAIGKRLNFLTGYQEKIDDASCQAMLIAACHLVANKQLS